MSPRTNATGKGTAIVASTLISVLVTSLLFLYAFPFLGIGQNGKILQSQSVETKSACDISDGDVVEENIADMTLVVPTHGNSKLVAELYSSSRLIMQNGFSGYAEYLIRLTVANVGNTTIIITYFIEAPSPSIICIPYAIFLKYETGILPAGNYNITASWKSLHDTAVSSSLVLSNGVEDAFNNTRSLSVNEIGM
jgi:hypothetical protein